MLKRLLLVAALLALLVVPALAQDAAQIELQPAEQAEDGTLLVDVRVTNGGDIAGADIAVSLDSACLQVSGMTPGDYLPSAAENGGFAPVNTFDAAGARLAANVTGREFIATTDGVFMTLLLDATCADATSTIEVTRAELVTANGEQFSASSTPLEIDLSVFNIANDSSAQPENETVSPPLAASGGDGIDPLMLVAVAMLLFGGLGFASLIGWRVLRMNAATA